MSVRAICSDKWRTSFLKRFFDIVVSAAGLCLLCPLFAVIAVWVRLDSPGPVFFRQTRVGRYGTLFRIHKFRTMWVGAESQGPLTIGDDRRMTKAGAWLRRYKLDELPQLIDVLIGNMSLVGPRPEVPQYVEFYPTEIREKILSLRPGITDWTSIQMIDESKMLGKSKHPQKFYVEVVLPKKMESYVQYVDGHTLTGDIKIIVATLAKIFTR